MNEIERDALARRFCLGSEGGKLSIRVTTSFRTELLHEQEQDKEQTGASGVPTRCQSSEKRQQTRVSSQIGVENLRGLDVPSWDQ